MPDFPVDVVVTYVDMRDTDWLASFNKYTNQRLPACRYRSFDNLKYFFRGIEKNIPWFRKLHLVVSSPSQVPTWLDTSNERLNIVYLKDYMPEPLVPIFNSNAIELFFYRIPDLAEHFLYFNDDMFCIDQCDKQDFFTESGDVKMCLKEGSRRVIDQWTKSLYNDIVLLRKYYPAFIGYQHDHSVYVLKKSVFTEFMEKEYDNIVSIFSKSKLRTNDDVSLHMIREYTALKEPVEPITINRKISNLRNEMEVVVDPDVKIICFNDNERLTYGFLRVKTEVNAFLDSRLPDKSSFEL